MAKLKLKSKTVELLSELNAENGPVYEMQEELEVIQLEEDAVELKGSQYGAYLGIKVEGSTRMVNIKGVTAADVDTEEKKATVLAALGKKFKLELWEAIRELPAQGTRRAIPKGQQKVFAVAA